jgi:hypothetical protein
MPRVRDDDDYRGSESPSEQEDPFAAVRAISTNDSDFPFDFGAFEQSEAEAAARATATTATATATPDPVSASLLDHADDARVIVPRSWLPPGDSVVETRPIGNMTVVTLRGRINESFRGVELGQSLSGVVVFDLSQVDRISSFGVKGWLQMLERARFTACYLFRCSEAVVNQITMMRNFCGPGRIHSFLAPYSCEACGEEFSVVYEAVPDREAILGRSPVAVRCPRCAAATKLADDPWAYLALDEHLLDHVPADLEQVLDHATGTNRMDPIEKFVSDEETRIRVNAPLDARLRLGRALNGVEGRVVIDLTPRQDLQAAGIQRLVDSIRDLEAEVSEVWIDGANRALLELLLRNPPPRTYISTAWVTAVAQTTGIRRPVLVDLKRKRSQLLRGEIPSVDAGWARGPMRYEEADLVVSAARHLFPTTSPATPTPLPSTLPVPSITPPTVHERHFAEARTPRTPGGMTPGGMTPGHLPPPPITPTALPGRSGSSVSTHLLVQVMAFVGVTLMLSTLAFTFVFCVAWYGLSQTQGPVAAPAPVVESQKLGWDGGNPLPPPWVEESVVVDAEGLRAVGLARADSAEVAAEQSRTQAIYRIVQYVAGQMGAETAGPALGTDPGDEAAEAVVVRFMGEVGAWASPVRINQAVKREAEGYTVATQHRLDAATLQRLLSYYRQTEEFRGLKVGRRFPFREPGASGVVVVRAETWFKSVGPGDTLVQIGTTPLATLEDFQRLAAEAWKNTAEGGRMMMWAEHVVEGGQGERVSLEFPRPVVPKREGKIDLLPLPESLPK